MGMGEKPQKKKINRMKEKPVWLPFHSPIYKTEADCFLVSKGAENKPDFH